MFRFVPSLHGDLDIASLRLALFHYICATQAGDKLLLRIEEQDSASSIQESVEMLALFGIQFSDVTYQSHNLKFHQQLATKLLMDKHAFSCFCGQEPCTGRCKTLSDEAVLNNENPFCVRINALDNHSDDFVILDVDKTPTPTFARALDDLLNDISMVICEEKDISDTPKEVMIRDYLGYDKEISYHYLPPITAEQMPSLKALLEEGILPSALINYLIMIAHPSQAEIFTLEEAMQWFDITAISKHPTPFDMEKLLALNVAHIKRLDDLELAKYIGYSSKDLGKLAKIYTQEGNTINFIKTKVDAIFAKKEPLALQEEFYTLNKIAKEAPYFKDFEEFKAYCLQESGLREEQLLLGLRVLLTGTQKGPDLSEIYPHIRNYLGEILP